MEDMEQIDVKNILKRVWQYLKYDKRKFISIIILVLFSTIISVITPLLIQNIIDNLTNKNTLNGISTFLIILAILFIISSIFSIITNIMMGSISEDALYHMRKHLFNKLQKLHIGFFDSSKKGDIMSRFSNDITNVGDALADAIVNVISSVILLIIVTIMMFYMNVVLAITTLLIVPFLFIIIMFIGKKASLYYEKNQTETGELSSLAEEYITNMKTIKQYEKEDFCIQKFDEINSKLRDTSISSETYASMILPANTAMSNIGNLLIIFVGSILILKGEFTIGGMIAFISYASMFRTPITNIASLFSELASAIAGAKRFFEIMDVLEEVKDDKKSIEISKLKGDVEFQNVSFGYTNKLILKNINLKVKKGEKVAIVGPTGAGKTTIVNLLTRFYETNDGNILLDGKNINIIKQKDLRKKIGIILQDNYLFKGTIKDNIRYSNKSATDDDIIKACKKAMAHQFIHRLPNGYDSIVEEGGINFSSGERQLISIARTILKNPDILILDEATSNIDINTEANIQKGMQQLMKNKTTFIIAHRLSTIKNADQILYLDNGKIIEKGKHEELLNQKGYYYKLYNSQFEDKI